MQRSILFNRYFCYMKLFFSNRNGNIVLEPIWRLQNGQGPSWKYAQAKVKAKGNYQVILSCLTCVSIGFYIYTFNKHFLYHFLYTFLFQVLVEGVWGNNRVSGFIAIDDVTFFSGDCDGMQIYF